MTLVPEGTPGARPVVVTALELLDPSDLRPSPEPPTPVRLRLVEPPDPALSVRCYTTVGGPWAWVDRLEWSDAQWREWVERPGHELWVLEEGGRLAGYFELDPDDDRDGSVEIAYLGLVTGSEGRGLGGWLLTRALQRAWELPGTRRVWVHTCELDGPAALPNYRARGMRDCGAWVEHRLSLG